VASVFARGPKTAPRWFARYKAADGRWMSRRVRQETRRDALRVAQALEAKAERQRLGLEAPEHAGQLVGPLMKRWAASLGNRAADTDCGRIAKHVLPHWQGARLVDVDLPRIMAWLDSMAEAGKIGAGSQRHCLGLLSRFMSWCVERGHAQRNACRDIPAGRRPRAIPPRPDSVPWVKTDDQAIAIMRALGAPWDAIFFLGNRSGLRLGEILGLRIGDLDDLGAGVIRVAHSYDGPLKEDRLAIGKTKWAPAPGDAAAVLAVTLEQRHAAGAGPEALVFVDQDGDPLDRHQVGYRWRLVRTTLELPADLSFYRATRHSACSRALASGADLTEVSAALGHASPAVTLRHYNHHIRKTFSPILRVGLGLDGAPTAPVIPMAGSHQTDTPAPRQPDRRDLGNDESEATGGGRAA
jgi:integrase